MPISIGNFPEDESAIHGIGDEEKPGNNERIVQSHLIAYRRKNLRSQHMPECHQSQKNA